jgi:hypothetical protein
MLTRAVLQQTLLDELKVEEHMLTSDMTLTAARCLWLKNSIWKKFQDEISEDADANCLKLFNESNERCRTFVLNPESSQDDELIGEVRSLWWDIVGNGPESNLELSVILDNTGVGPGANIGARSYNFYTKLFDSPLTGTSERLYRFYRYSIMANPTWLSAEKARENRYGHRIVAGNRLSFVPKTSDISRSICTEPTLNMFLQKGIGYALEQQLRRRFRIDLSQQPELNRRLAREGSANDTYCTIDLSSASDSISLKMLRDILPEELLNWLELARSPNVIFPDGTMNELYMVSSMGNGFTFPLETLLFSTIVVACYRVLGIKPKYGRSGPENWAVFGDDIIVRKDSYDFVVRALRLFGFSVNDSKSFNSGYFRESCGGDYFRGHNIRGVYCKSLLTGADVYSLINRLVRWSAESGVFIPRTVSLLKRLVDFLPIPFQDGDAEGIKVPYPPAGLARDPNTGAVKYRALVKVPKSVRIPLSSDQQLFFRHHKRRRETFYNSDGIMVAFVGGFIRDGRISVRDDRETFKIRNRLTSSWASWKRSHHLRNLVDRVTSGKPLQSVSLSVEDNNSPAEDWEIFCEIYS